MRLPPSSLCQVEMDQLGASPAILHCTMLLLRLLQPSLQHPQHVRAGVLDLKRRQ